MLKNYFKVMFRSFRRRKAYAVINLLGLATGIAVCLLLVLYIQNELGYDAFHQKGDQIYRLALERVYPGRVAHLGSLPPAIGKAIKQDFPEVLESTRMMGAGGNNVVISVGDKTFEQANLHLMAVDSNFFQVFSAEVLQGNPDDALSKPGTAVLNETTARKYFGSPESALGKSFTFENRGQYMVGAVVKDWPEKTHFKFDMLLSVRNFFNSDTADYYDLWTYNYLLLRKDASPEALEAKLPQIVKKYVAPTIAKGFGESYEQFIAEGNGYRYFLQPLKKIHLTSELEDEMEPTSSMRVIILFGVVAAFILFLACINFVNLSTAFSLERAREVGIRKVFGSDKSTLVWQFLGESVFFSFSATCLALLITFLCVPFLNQISGDQLSFSWFLDPVRLAILCCFGLAVGIVAGIYPAFVLSAFQPIVVLKGRMKSSRVGLALRNGLVVFQFAVSILLIVSTLVINRQMQYVLGDRLGFQKDNVMQIYRTYGLGQNRNAFIDQLSNVRGVQTVSLCNDLPGGDVPSCAMQVMGTQVQRTQKTMYVDENYQGLLGLHLKEGRFFSKDFPTDSFALVLTTRAVKDFGLKNPIGARITSTESFFNPPDGKSQSVYTVIGVVDDFHFQSLHFEIAPLVMANERRLGAGSVAIRIDGNHFQSAVADVLKLWKTFDPRHTIEFTFLDEKLAVQYKAEITSRKIFSAFSCLAIFIACIGLFGLATYSTYQRTREMGIRKVLGANSIDIVYILSQSFLRLVLIAMVVALPLAWWAMHTWLQAFAYRSPLSWWIFLLAGASTVLIAFSTISFQAIRAALAKPVKSLRTD